STRACSLFSSTRAVSPFLRHYALPILGSQARGKELSQASYLLRGRTTIIGHGAYCSSAREVEPSSMPRKPPCAAAVRTVPDDGRDRKSTRLNSSHVSSSYAVLFVIQTK